MSISAISGGQSPRTDQVQQARQHSHAHSGVRKAAMDAAAQALGMSVTDLQTATKSGQSLAAIAQSRGVSSDTVAAAITAAVTKANPSVSSVRAEQIAHRMIEGPETTMSGGTGAGDRDHDGDSH